MNILVVEDDRVQVDCIASLLELWGHRTETATTLGQAEDMAACQAYDLILLDIFLPDGQGHQRIPRFRELIPGVGFITMTGQNTRDLELEVRRYGIHYFMAKPLEIDALRAVIEHIERTRSTPGNRMGTGAF